MGAELFYADGQTDVTMLIVAFRNFANAPKKENSSVTFVCCLMTYQVTQTTQARHPPEMLIFLYQASISHFHDL